jgi:nucleoid-associated protein EbfC
MQKAREELANETVEATAGVAWSPCANGAGEITEIKIDPKAIDPEDPEMLEDMAGVSSAPAMSSASGRCSGTTSSALHG